ncbi:MAG: DUF5685 family protein [Oscillospiraceae bacterium]
MSLSAFRAPEKAGESRKCHCPAHVARRSCELGGDAMDLAADFSVLLYYWKLRDAVADERGLRRFGARLASLLLRRAYRKAAARRGRAGRAHQTAAGAPCPAGGGP